MAPLARLSVGKATTRAGSNTSRWPMPSQAGHAPISLLPAHAQLRLDALGQALLQVGAHLDAVDHRVDGVLLGFLERGQVLVLVDLAIHPKADVAQRLHLCEQLGELAL